MHNAAYSIMLLSPLKWLSPSFMREIACFVDDDEVHFYFSEGDKTFNLSVCLAVRQNARAVGRSYHECSLMTCARTVVAQVNKKSDNPECAIIKIFWAIVQCTFTHSSCFCLRDNCV